MRNGVKIVPLAIAAALTACGGGGSSSGNKTGELSLGITDGPVENASAVVVAFSSVELHGAENRVIEFDNPQTINLLDYQGEDRVLLLDNEIIAAGAYQWIRLGVDESASYIEVDGMQYGLEIPSGDESGLKMNRGITIGAGSSSDFTIDFDLRKSVTQEGTGDYKLRPTLRLVDNLEVNTINGTVAESLITDVNCNNGDNNDTGNAVYLFEGLGATAKDIQGNEDDPLVSATVNYNNQSEQYEFVLGYVPLGDYTAAFTCDASLDVNDEDNSEVVSFSDGVNVTVVADSEASISIP
ncbi:MAG TPA: DUF4382 domain-containing protein [Porticoccus sp.]|nr:DUF4382 domain-containing protein [Porticoccus sp.]